MKAKSFISRTLCALAGVFLAVPANALVNPNITTSGGCWHCNEETGKWVFHAKSFYFQYNAGWSRYSASNNYLDYARTGVSEGIRHGGDHLRRLDDIVDYYNRAGDKNRQQVRLELSGATISSDLRDPANLTINPNSSAEVMELNGFVNQVLTDDALTHIEKLTDGFRLRSWNLSTFTLGIKTAGLYPIPTEDPISEVTFDKLVGTTGDHDLLVTTVDNSGSVSRSLTQHYNEIVAGSPEVATSMTIKTYEGSGTSGDLLKIEELTYSNRGSKVWDYHVRRKIWTANTAADGAITSPTQTAPFLTLDNYEEYKDFSTSTAGGGKGAYRLVRKVVGEGIVGVGATVYTYIDNSSNSHLHGRLKTVTHPDGSWEHYDYTDSPNASIFTETKYSSWKDVTIASRANARKVVTTVESGKITRTTSVAGQQITKSETTHSTNVGGESIITTKRWDGTAWHTSTTCRFPQGAGALTAGRIKWIEHADGTATSFAYAAAGGNTEVTIRSGAGDQNGVTSGSQTVRTRNDSNKVISEVITDIDSGITTGTWTGSIFDILGRPERIDYLDGSHSLIEHDCCGGGTTATSRSGATSSTSRDPLGRTYLVESKNSSTSTTISTTTTFSGLTTTTERSDGTTTLLLSEVTRSLSGLTTTSLAPDADGDSATDEETTRAVTYNVGGGMTTTVTYPDTTTTSSVTYLDGQMKSSTDQESNVTTYDYGTHATNGGGLWSQTTSPVTTQWVKQYSDHFGRNIKTEYPDGAETLTSYYSSTADAGSRGKVSTMTDPDENDTAGTGTSVTYTYTSEGERDEVQEALANSHTRTTVTANSVVDDTVSGIGDAYKTTTTVNTKLVSTTYQAVNGLSAKTIGLGGGSSSVQTLPADGAWTTTSTSPDGQQNKSTYSEGRLEKQEFFDNQTTPVLISSVSYNYDDFGRTETEVDSRTGTTTINGHFENGAVTSVTTKGGADTTSYDYDVMGRVTQVTLPDSSTTNTSYTDRGQVLATWGSQTYPRLCQYDSLGRMNELRTYQGLAHGTEPTTQSAGFASTFWIYDVQRGWLLEKNYHGENDDPTANPVVGVGDYTYTLAGRLKTRTWERGLVTTYGYDQGSLDTVTYTNDATKTPNVSYSYDNFGRTSTIIQSKNGSGTSPLTSITYGYDAASLALSSETIAYDTDADGTADLTKVLNHYHDPYLRPKSSEISGDYTTAYGYDDGGRLNNVWSHPVLDGTTKDPAGTADFVYDYQANSASLVKTVTGPAHTVTNFWEGYRNILLSKKNEGGSPTKKISQYSYSMAGAAFFGANSLGQRKNVTTTGLAFDHNGSTFTFTNEAAVGPAYSWSYNGRGEVVESNDSSAANYDRAYQYDSIGNREKTVDGLLINLPGTSDYDANEQNQYTRVNGVDLPTPAYDADGNHTNGSLPVATGNATLVWDAENRLVEITRADTTVIKYAYDALSRRVRKKVGAATADHYIYDSWNLIAEYTGITLSKTYVWGMDLSGSAQGAGGVGGLLAVKEGSSTYYPTYDGNGNVSEYLNSSSTVEAHYEYDAFGNTLVAGGSKKNNFLHRFSTKPLDDETGLYYYGYRYYDPVTGRWPSRDPIGERDFKNEAVEYSEILSQSSSLSQLAETELSNLASLSGLSPIHYRSVKKELEKSGRKASRNLYGFVQNDSVSSYDLFGLLKVCSSHAFGSPLANHAYLNGSDDGATSCGQNGSSGKGDPTGDGAPNNPGDPCNEVALPPGKSPREAASCICNCMKRKGETSLPWLPGANDCHKQLKDCFKECGIAYPGAPGGRLNPPKPSGKKRCRCFHPSRR